MKKNISINISGIIFHIEEDGYDTLRKYLDSINSYFGSFEDSSEILADIESRIAEIFLSKLNDGKQIITAEDVQSLTSTMGSVNDFKAAEAQEADTTEKTKSGSAEEEPAAAEAPRYTASKRLVRDHSRKILGGVCAGLGNYFGIDPVWPRIIFALAVIGTYGIFIAVYIVLWIALPFSTDLPEEASVKKMYRDPDEKVIGGVAAGVAAFFGTDIVVIRVLFGVSAFFFGTGIMLYIILWIVLPEAKTITDKMKMQGEPVTLSNIESSVKKSISEKDGAEESAAAKILLFPFRIVAAVIAGIARILGPVFMLIIDIFRVGIGLVFSMTGLILIISLIFVTGVMLGLFSFDTMHWGQMNVSGGAFPLAVLRNAFPTWTVIIAFIGAVIPGVLLLLIGSSIITKRNIISPIVGWTLFVLFFISAAFLAIRIPQLVYSFKEEGEVRVEKLFPVEKTALLKIKENGLDDFSSTHLMISGYDGKEIKLVQKFRAQGVTRAAARENAVMVIYNVDQQDSVITFDSNLGFKQDAHFSFQRLNMELLIPYNKPFAVDPELWHLIHNHWSGEFQKAEDVQTYHFNTDGKMECASCPPAPKEASGFGHDDQFGLKDFKEIEMTGIFNTVIRQGDRYSITLEGTNARKRLYTLTVNDGTLEVNYGEHKKSFWNDSFSSDEMVTLNIELPSLENLKVTGAGKVKIMGFRENDMKLSFLGAMVVDGRFSSNQLFVDASGPVVIELDGDGDFIEANISKTAQLKAQSYTVNRALVEAKEIGQVRLNVSQSLEADKDFTSTVKNSGNAEIIKKD